MNPRQRQLGVVHRQQRQILAVLAAVAALAALGLLLPDPAAEDAVDLIPRSLRVQGHGPAADALQLGQAAPSFEAQTEAALEREAEDGVPQDPRLLKHCIDVHGRRGNDPKSPAIWTVEDVIANRREVGANADGTTQHSFFDATGGGPRRNKHASLGRPYGRNFLAHDHNAVRWVEIPKTGSVTVKYFLREGSDPFTLPTKGSPSFTTVREPLRRFISGYGTVKKGCSEQLKEMGVFVDGASEADDFGRFVDLVLETGDQTDELVGGECGRQYGDIFHVGWEHTLSQMWFIDLWEDPINYVVRFEDLDNQFSELVKTLDLQTNPERSVIPHANQKQGRQEPQAQVLLHPGDVSKLVEGYLKQDYICLQYEFPDIHNVSLY